MQITEQNIEELILLYVDGELDPLVAADMLDYIGRYPQYAGMLEDYQQTILAPDTEIVYQDKASLIRPETTVAPLKKKRWALTATAAAILLLLSVWAINRLNNNMERPAVKNIAKSHTGPAQIAPPNLPDASSGATVAKRNVINKHTPARKTKSNKPDSNAGHNTIANAKNKPQEQHNIKPLPSQDDIIRLQTNIELNTTMAVVIQPQTEIAEPTRSKLPEWIPGRDEKIDVVNELVAQFNEIKERFAAGGRTLKNASFALKFGDKEIGFGKKNNN